VFVAHPSPTLGRDRRRAYPCVSCPGQAWSTQFDVDLRNTDGSITGTVGTPLLVLAHHRARAYNLLHGRWMQRDSAEYVDGMNLYEYVRDAPVHHVDPSGRFKLAVHRDVTRSGYALFRKLFRTRNGLASMPPLEVVLDANGGTDKGTGFFNKDRHGQSDDFVGEVHQRMEEIRAINCPSWYSEVEANKVLGEVGEALHTLQDFYTHSDWLEGSNMNPAYKYSSDRIDSFNWDDAPIPYPRDFKAFVGNETTQKPRANMRLDTSKLAENSFSASGTVRHDVGGSTGKLAAWDLQNTFAAEEPAYGRSVDPPQGLGSGAFTRARDAAVDSTRDFFEWAHDNMTPCCRRQLFKE